MASKGLSANLHSRSACQSIPTIVVTALLLAIQAVSGDHTYAGVVFNGTVLDFQEEQIYHSPETPGYTCWVGLWQLPQSGAIECGFYQNAYGVESGPILQTSDLARTWSRVAGDIPNGNMRGMAVLSDQVMVQPMWNTSGSTVGVGYTQRSADGGKTWVRSNFVSETDYRVALPVLVKPLSDGRLVLVAGLWARDGSANMIENVQKAMFVSSDQGQHWGPPIPIMPLSTGTGEESDFVELRNGDLQFISRAEHYDAGGVLLNENRMQTTMTKVGDSFTWNPSTVPFAVANRPGFPCELLTREGVILDLSNRGSHYSTDSGATWHDLMVNGQQLNTYYYPKSLQMADGTILVVGHRGSDDVPGTVDQAIMQQTFRLSPVPEPSALMLLGIGALNVFVYAWRNQKSGVSSVRSHVFSKTI
jgi:hypothetical protein